MLQTCFGRFGALVCYETPAGYTSIRRSRHDSDAQLAVARTDTWEVDLAKEQSLGIRSFPDGFSCVVLAGTQGSPSIVHFERYAVPKNSNWPEQLVWSRRQLAEVCHLHKPRRACIKAIESNARTISRPRLQLEGVLIEFLQSEMNIECHSRIKSQLKRDIDGFDAPARYLGRVIEAHSEFTSLKHPNFEEACLAAISELKKSA